MAYDLAKILLNSHDLHRRLKSISASLLNATKYAEGMGQDLLEKRSRAKQRLYWAMFIRLTDMVERYPKF